MGPDESSDLTETDPEHVLIRVFNDVNPNFFYVFNENPQLLEDYFSKKHMRVILMTPDEHDRMVAYSQGITHYIGRVLSDLKLKPTLINTLGYQKLLEIVQQTCNDSWQLFTDLQKYNPYTKNMRIDLHKSIERIYKSLGDDNT